MVTSLSSSGLSSSALLNYYSAQLMTASANTVSSSSSSRTSSSSSATAADKPPWTNYNQPSQPVRDAKVLNITNFLDTSNVPLSAGSSIGTKTEQDNQKLFSLYTALNNLSYLAGMSQRADATPGQRVGYNTRFQTGLTQVKDYLKTATFNNFTLQLGKPQSSVTSTATVPFPTFNYAGGTVVSDANLSNALPNVSTSNSFTIGVTKGGTTTNVAINFANISGPLTLDNIVNYADQQLKAAGFSSTLARVMTQGSINDPTKASYGISVKESPGETLSFSSAAATPALYLAGNSGSSQATSTKAGSQTYTTAASQQGRLVKLSNLSSGSPTSSFNETLNPDTGNTTTTATAVDSNGNIYTIGTATGNFGSELNQGTQDVVLSKYDSAGNLQWTKLLGSAGSADSYSLALDSNNNVIVAGSTTANLTTTGVADGNPDTFVAKYDTNGNQTWVKQIPTLSANGANSVSVDSSGNIYIGGQVSGVIGAGQTNNGGQDGYVAKLSSSGAITYEQQLGTSGKDTVAATAVDANGNLFVASVQNGNAILTKYANGDATSTPVWQENLGALGNGGSIGGIALSNGKVYLSGTSSNGALTSGGQASVVGGTSGGLDTFVAGFTDSGSTVTQNTVTYIGTSGTDTAGKLTVGPSGTVYLAGTTTGTFAGQSRTATGTENAFVSALNSSGSVTWTKQFGGASGTSTGAAVAIDQSGSSVLDALGLPRGTVDINQSVDLTSATTLRAGDSFQIKINKGSANYTKTITIDAGETLQSLATKISAAMVFDGKATVAYGSGSGGGNALKIQVDPGVSATLIAGPADFDALGRLGITPGTISNGTNNSSSSSSSSSSSGSSTNKQVFGLGFSGLPLSIADTTNAGSTKAQLQNVLSSIQQIYSKTNTQTGSSSGLSGLGTQSGTVPSYLQAQTASYQLALASLSSYSSGLQSNSSGGGSSTLQVG